MSSSIQAIDKTSVHRICSGQVVLSLATAVKELVENSIDAGATSVEVRLKEYGSDTVEVVDNGKGVEEENFEALTLKHHTSKLRDFSDLTSVETFGFRGEALSSLCALSKISVVTRHKDATVAHKLEFDNNGKLTSKTPCARQQGTTVSLQSLFSTMPVRYKEFQRNLKKEFNKMVQVLNAYCVISTGVKITTTNQTSNGKKSLVVSTNANESVRENITNIFGAKQVQNIVEFKQESPAQAVCEDFGVSSSEGEEKIFTIRGYISNAMHGNGRSSTDRQFFYINKRPMDSQKVSRIVNEVYHMYNRQQYPFVVLDISIDKECVDVNVTPDKRQIFLQHEKLLYAIIKSSLVKLLEPHASVFSTNQALTPSGNAVSGGLLVRRTPSGALPLMGATALFKQWTPPGDSSPSPSPSSGLASLKRNFSSAFAKQSPLANSPTSKQPRLDGFVQMLDKSVADITEEEITEETETDSQMSHHFKQSSTETLDSFADGPSFDIELTQGAGSSSSNGIDIHIPPPLLREVELTSINSTGDMSCSSLGNLSSLGTPVASSTQQHLTLNQQIREATDTLYRERNIPEKETFREENRSHTEALTKNTMGETRSPENCQKYEKMQSSKEPPQDLGVRVILEEPFRENPKQEKRKKVAAVPTRTDEKEEGGQRQASNKEMTAQFSFAAVKEKLTAKWRDQDQKEEKKLAYRLFRAQISPTDNQAAEQELQKEITKDMFREMRVLGQFNLGFIIARLGMDLFIIDQHATDEKYNFEQLQASTVIQTQKLIHPQPLELTAANEAIVADNLDIFRVNGFELVVNEDAPPTQRILLLSKPSSKNWEFGREDIDELIFMLSDSPGVMCRPSRVRSMFASRSCRKSVMIGTALSKPQMMKLIQHMGEIEQPWNCPHGRPTMRHLINLNVVQHTNAAS